LPRYNKNNIIVVENLQYIYSNLYYAINMLSNTLNLICLARIFYSDLLSSSEL